VSIALTGAGFESSVAYLARTTVGSTYSLITIPVKNTGTTLVCFVYATFKVFGSSGALLATFTPLVTGSVGYGGDPTVYTDTCLQPGESGFLLDFDDLQLDLFTNARSATLTITADKIAAYRLSSSVVQATAFVNSVSTGIETITVKNIGTVTANLSAVGSTVILLDANYYPLYWDFLYPQAGSEVLEPGELGYLTDDATLRNFGAGSAPYQLVHVSFEGTLASALVSDGSAAGVARQKRAALRARRLPGQ
jgi:archaellum component FlaG (FlaF/FlaG flagellin family)